MEDNNLLTSGEHIPVSKTFKEKLVSRLDIMR